MSRCSGRSKSFCTCFLSTFEHLYGYDINALHKSMNLFYIFIQLELNKQKKQTLEVAFSTGSCLSAKSLFNWSFTLVARIGSLWTQFSTKMFTIINKRTILYGKLSLSIALADLKIHRKQFSTICFHYVLLMGNLNKNS